MTEVKQTIVGIFLLAILFGAALIINIIIFQFMGLFINIPIEDTKTIPLVIAIFQTVSFVGRKLGKEVIG